MKEKIEPNLDELEKTLNMPVAKSFAPPTERGIHELIQEIDDLVATVQHRVEAVKKRLEQFAHLQDSFYNGRKP